jgi:hypothetical protein
MVTHPGFHSSPLPRKFWWSGPGLNRQPPACKADALPIELPPRSRLETTMVGLGRVELPTSPLSGARSSQLSYRPSRRRCRRRDCPSRQYRLRCGALATRRSDGFGPLARSSFRFADCQRPKSPQREAQASQNRIVMRRDPDSFTVHPAADLFWRENIGRLTWSGSSGRIRESDISLERR